jgi:hypothetical protein
MPDLVLCVSVVADLRQENCNELADKLRGCLETYQSDDAAELERLYLEARRVAREKERERQIEEWEQEKERERRKQEQERWEQEQDRQREEYWGDVYQSQLSEDELREERERAEEERRLALAYDPWWEISAEVIAEIQKNGIPQLTEKQRAELKRVTEKQRAELKRDQTMREVRDLLRDCKRELTEQRQEWQQFSWNATITLLPEIMERLDEQEEKIRNVEDQISYLQT